MRVVAIMLVLAGTAHADPTESLRARGERIAEEHGPYLQLEPMRAPDLESFDAKRDQTVTAIAIGNTLVLLKGDWWEGDRDDPMHPSVDQPGNGWRSGIRLARDLGFAKISVGGALGHVDTPNGSGTYRQVDLALSRSKRFSRWMTGFVAFGVGFRRWYGIPPPGEANGHQVMLTIGTTFR
ncbi:MAG: hypothetical protein ABI867_19555 [Kofleriaceae bacterium]